MKLNEISARSRMATLVGVMLACALCPGSGPRADEGHVDRVTQAALKLDANPKRGGETFGQVCAHCHGAKAHGDARRAIPALAGQRFAYLVRQLANFAGGERESAPMHGIVSQPQLHDSQAWVDIAAYVNALPVAAFEVTGDGSGVALGRGIFHEQCASCHRPDARGDDAGFVPALRNQHYSYLVSQMHKLAAGVRHNADEDLVRFLRSFDNDDIAAVADYLSRLRGSGVDRKRMRDDGVVVD